MTAIPQERTDRVCVIGAGSSGLASARETHPIINTLLPYFVRNGALVSKPDVERFDGHVVVFRDGSRETFDLAVFATEYSWATAFNTETRRATTWRLSTAATSRACSKLAGSWR